jgi:hypothetical protein
MGRSARRLHHSISWDNAVPRILDDHWRKKDLPKYEVIFEDVFPENDKIIVDYKPEVQIEAIPEAVEEEVIVEPEIVSLQEARREYFGEYCVSFSFELQEKEGWDRPMRATGTKDHCEEFIKNNKPN